MNIRPITITPRNAEQATGFKWRWLCDHAAELGIEIITIDGKRCIIAARLLAALERYAAHAEPVVEPENDVEDEIAEMRRRVARAG
jgi:hypothetical protein